MGKTYKIKNDGNRATGFRVRGGIETVGPGKTRTLELKEDLDEVRIKQLQEQGFSIAEADSAKAENPPTRFAGSIAERMKRAGLVDDVPENPAETGGERPKSSVSEVGGVKRAPTDTTTTTKPTEKHTGPVA